MRSLCESYTVSQRCSMEVAWCAFLHALLNAVASVATRRRPSYRGELLAVTSADLVSNDDAQNGADHRSGDPMGIACAVLAA